jgi:DNA topoisomerase I
MHLVIVESPTKAKTISKFLGSEYKVESSFGHIRDLPKSNMGIDIENGFVPKYIVPLKAKKRVSSLKELAKKAESVILATDEDREGEAIAWHLANALGMTKKEISSAKRIVFHEITKDAISEALKNPRSIDENLVDAQQARRILDRLVGYELSPFLWKKVIRGLSAGRVQSVAVRLVVEREREIDAFQKEEYWTIDADLKRKVKADDKNFLARLSKINGKSIDKLDIKDKTSADAILAALEGKSYAVKHLEQKETKKNPLPPFMTSTLQQTSNRWLNMSAKDTMRNAQQLYEGVELPGEGSVGLITYMRTDSLHLSDNFLNEAKDWLRGSLGEKYSLNSPRRFKTKSKGAQEAHEAIRPTSAARDPESLKNALNPKQYKLYKLIWQRAMASQMPPAIVDSTIVDIDALDTVYQFRANGHIIRFNGFLEIYPEKSKEVELPELEIGEVLDLLELVSGQHFTKPPARYSDAGLVKELERFGIGRPSTYAPTIATIEARNYVNRDEDKRLKPTDIAFVVNDLLVAHFNNIVDFEFTANLENDLDSIAEGEKKWQDVIGDFYWPFHKNLEEKTAELKKEDIMPEETTAEVCDKCGKPMIIKHGRFGKFLACSGFPDCKNSKPLNAEGTGADKEKDEKLKELTEKYAGEKCEKCGADMAVKNGRFGPFLACSTYPKCKTIKNIKENGMGSTGIACPACGEGEIVAKRSRRGVFYACNRYPDCKTSFASKPTGEKCPACDSLLVQGKNDEIKCSKKGCDYKKQA